MTDGSLRFTMDSYRQFLESFLEEGYTFHGFEPLSKRAAVVRHDVDLSPDRALEMARTESDIGVETTYCFMLTTPAYNLLRHVDALEEIQALGHDLALHFDTHHYWDSRPGTKTLESTVRSECELLGELADTTVDTVSFHMPKEWSLNATYEGFTNTYQPEFFGDIEYISDSRQKWRNEAPFDGDRPDQVQILTHPGLWTPTNRRMDDIIASLTELRYERVDRFVEAY